MSQRFDQLFAKVATPYDSPEGLVEKLSVERTRGSGYAGLSAFRKLRQADRIKEATDFLKRKRPKTAEEHLREEQAKRPPISRVFLWDGYGSGSSIYDGDPGEFVVNKVNHDVVWRPGHPFAMRKIVPHIIEDIEDIPPLLIRLAGGLKRAFKVTLKALNETHQRYGFVLMPKGDRRAERLAQKPENAIEIDGLLKGTALLFVSDNLEETGLITQYDCQKNGPYGMAVWGLFYAIEIEFEPHGFDRDPRI